MKTNDVSVPPEHRHVVPLTIEIEAGISLVGEFHYIVVGPAEPLDLESIDVSSVDIEATIEQMRALGLVTPFEGVLSGEWEMNDGEL